MCVCVCLFWWSFRSCFVYFHQYMPKAWVNFYTFSCLLILKMCKLRAKTCYDYYWWAYLFRGGILFGFLQLFSYPTLWSVSLYKSMCVLIESGFICSCQFCWFLLDALFSFQFYLGFANCCCQVLVFCLRSWSCVDILYGE